MAEAVVAIAVVAVVLPEGADAISDAEAMDLEVAVAAIAVAAVAIVVAEAAEVALVPVVLPESWSNPTRDSKASTSSAAKMMLWLPRTWYPASQFTTRNASPWKINSQARRLNTEYGTPTAASWQLRSLEELKTST